MEKLLLLAVIFSQSSILYVHSENKFLSVLVENIMTCVSEASENFTMDTCQEMMKKGNNNSSPKYNDCKCLVACAGKRLELINEKGEGNIEKFNHLVSLIDHDQLSKEATTVVNKCKNVKHSNPCEFAFEWLKCAVNTSKMTYDLLKTFLGESESSKSASDDN